MSPGCKGWEQGVPQNRSSCFSLPPWLGEVLWRDRMALAFTPSFFLWWGLCPTTEKKTNRILFPFLADIIARVVSEGCSVSLQSSVCCGGMQPLHYIPLNSQNTWRSISNSKGSFLLCNHFHLEYIWSTPSHTKAESFKATGKTILRKIVKCCATTNIRDILLVEEDSPPPV